MSRAATALLNLQALKHNLSVVRRTAPHSKILAVIKANAYGHGMLTIAEAISDADGFAVAHFEEAMSLRREHPEKPIVLLQGFADASELHDLLANNIQLVVHNFQHIEVLESIKLPVKNAVWLKIDTGMKRLGFNSDQVEEAWHRLSVIPSLKNNLRIMSHFANADDVSHSGTNQQIELFEHLTVDYDVEKSLANSAGILAWENAQFDWVRPGIMLYGVSPFLDKTANELDLQAVMQLSSQVIAVKPIKKGEFVGYGHCWQADADGYIAVVGIGYGDGYPRHIKADTPVLISGVRYPIVGRVSMDMLCVDLGKETTIKVGDEVLLWGDGLPVEEIAEMAGTIAYELLCQVTQRVRFETIDG